MSNRDVRVKERTWICGKCGEENSFEYTTLDKCPVCLWTGGTRPFVPRSLSGMKIKLR